MARLHEPRVRRVLEPLMAGTVTTSETYQEDVQYLRDLGLCAPNNPLRVANPLYREVIARVLASARPCCACEQAHDRRLGAERPFRSAAAREHGERMAPAAARRVEDEGATLRRRPQVRPILLEPHAAHALEVISRVHRLAVESHGHAQAAA